MPKIIKAHAQQFLLGELLWILKGKSLPSLNKVCDAFVISLLGLIVFYDINSSLGVVELSGEFLFPCLSKKNASL